MLLSVWYHCTFTFKSCDNLLMYVQAFVFKWRFSLNSMSEKNLELSNHISSAFKKVRGWCCSGTHWVCVWLQLSSSVGLCLHKVGEAGSQWWSRLVVEGFVLPLQLMAFDVLCVAPVFSDKTFSTMLQRLATFFWVMCAVNALCEFQPGCRKYKFDSTCWRGNCGNSLKYMKLSVFTVFCFGTSAVNGVLDDAVNEHRYASFIEGQNPKCGPR